MGYFIDCLGFMVVNNIRKHPLGLTQSNILTLVLISDLLFFILFFIIIYIYIFFWGGEGFLAPKGHRSTGGLALAPEKKDVF